MSKYAYFEERIQKTFEQRRFKQLRCIVPHDISSMKMLDFTSHDFLGMSTHDYVKKQSIKAVLQWGAGSIASRRINGHIDYQQKLEKRIAQVVGSEEAVLFSSTYQIHSSILPTLINKQTVVFIDRFASPFLYQSIEHLSSRIIRFEHNNIHDLERHLHKHSNVPSHQKFVITESLFAASGDYIPIQNLIDTTNREKALLYVDDSNTMGVKGQNGLGYATYRRGIDFLITSFGKAGGCFGAYIALPTLLKDYIGSLSPSIVAMPPLPPAVLGAIDAAITLLPDMHQERTRLEELSEYTRTVLYKMGLDYGKSRSHIIPIQFETDEAKNQMGDYLEERSIYVQRSMKRNHERPSLRILLSTWHTKGDIEILLTTLQEGLHALEIRRPSLASAYIP